MHRAGPLHKEGLKLNEPLWDVRVEEDDIFLYFLWEVESIWIKNKTKKLSTGQKGKKATFTNALLIPRWLRSPVSNLLPHFLCYEMLGIVLSWLSCISIKSEESEWKTQWTLPSFVRQGSLPIFLDECVSVRRELKLDWVNLGAVFCFSCSLRDSEVLAAWSIFILVSQTF